jgi:hypothetical protein
VIAELEGPAHGTSPPPGNRSHAPHRPQARSPPRDPAILTRAGAGTIIVGRTAKETTSSSVATSAARTAGSTPRTAGALRPFVLGPNAEKTVPLDVLLDAGNRPFTTRRPRSAGEATSTITQVK